LNQKAVVVETHEPFAVGRERNPLQPILVTLQVAKPLAGSPMAMILPSCENATQG